MPDDTTLQLANQLQQIEKTLAEIRHRTVDYGLGPDSVWDGLLLAGELILTAASKLHEMEG